MIQCSNCQAELVTESLASGRDIRCSSCGKIITREWLGGTNFSYRDAWWSLGWGLSSIFLLCFAGIPAVYLGIRALLRMRYRTATLGARRAAIWGIITGGLFGILMGGALMVVGVIVFVFWATTEQTDDPQRGLAILHEIVSLDLDYEQIKPQLALHSNVFLSLVQLVDSPEKKDQRVNIKLLRLPTWMSTNRAQFANMLRDEYLNSSRKYRRGEAEILTWKIGGRDVAVTKIVSRFEKPSDDAETAVRIIQYFFLTDFGNNTYGLVLIHQPPDSKLDEEKVQKIFESFRVVQ